MVRKGRRSLLGPFYFCTLLSVVYLSGEGLAMLNLYTMLGNFLCPGSYLVSDFITCCSSCLPFIAHNGLEPGKLYVYSPDKTLIYTFDSVEQAARELTPARCSHLSDLEISQRKNIRYIRRVINKGVLTTTEKGKFYLYQKSNHSSHASFPLLGKLFV